MKLHSIHINEHVTVIHPPHFVPGKPPVRSSEIARLRICKCGGEGAELGMSGVYWIECKNCGKTTLCGGGRQVRRQWNKHHVA